MWQEAKSAAYNQKPRVHCLGVVRGRRGPGNALRAVTAADAFGSGAGSV